MRPFSLWTATHINTKQNFSTCRSCYFPQALSISTTHTKTKIHDLLNVCFYNTCVIKIQIVVATTNLCFLAFTAIHLNWYAAIYGPVRMQKMNIEIKIFEHLWKCNSFLNMNDIWCFIFILRASKQVFIKFIRWRILNCTIKDK